MKGQRLVQPAFRFIQLTIVYARQEQLLEAVNADHLHVGLKGRAACAGLIRATSLGTQFRIECRLKKGARAAAHLGDPHAVWVLLARRVIFPEPRKELAGYERVFRRTCDTEVSIRG